MNLLGITNSDTKAVVKYIISLFDTKHISTIDFTDFEGKTNTTAAKIEDSKFLVIALTNEIGLDTIEQWVSKTPNKTVFENKSILLISLADYSVENTKLTIHADKQFTRVGANLLGTFHLPNYKTNFNFETGITDVKLNLTLMRTINQIKQTNFHNYFIKRASTCGIDNTGFENCDASSY